MYIDSFTHQNYTFYITHYINSNTFLPPYHLMYNFYTPSHAHHYHELRLSMSMSWEKIIHFHHTRHNHALVQESLPRGSLNLQIWYAIVGQFYRQHEYDVRGISNFSFILCPFNGWNIEKHNIKSDSNNMKPI